MLIIFFLICAAVTFGVMFGTYWSQSNYQNGMLFAVKLPKEAERHRELKRIRERFKHDMKRLIILLAITAVPLLLLPMAFGIVYFILWLTAGTLFFVFPFRRAHRETLALKRKNNWFVSAKPAADGGALSSHQGDGGGGAVLSDGDEYWGNGFTYHNPHDKRLFVEKRVGIGLTVNTGTRAGKWLMGLVLGVTAVVLIGVSVLMVWSELSPPTISFADDGQRVKIDYILYSVQFPVAAMQDVSLVDTIPKGRKTNGEATTQVMRGHFKLEGLGKSRLYVFRNNPPYIRIQLEDGYIFYNEEDSEETRRVYEQLLQSMDR